MILVKTSKTRARYSRRALLSRLGASAALLPLVHAERALAAGADGFPKRLVTIVYPHGVAQPNYYSTTDDPTAGEILKPLAPWKNKVTVPAGLDIKVMLDDNRRYDGHFSYPSLYTGTYRNVSGQVGTSTGPSVDHVVSQAIAAKVNLPVPLMNVAVEGNSTSYRGADQRNTAETDPKRMFTTLFSGRTMPPAQVDNLRNRRASVLDFLGKELTAFCGRLGTEDRAKCEAHHDSIRMLEKQLQSTGGGVAGASCAPVMPGTVNDFPTRVKAFVDLAAMALRCDVTRVVSMTWGDNGGGRPTTMAAIGVPGDYHNAIAHAGSAQYPAKTKIDAWYFTMVAALVKQLDEAVEASSTALDNSLVCVASDMSEGSRHDIGGGIPFALVGTAGGYIKAGRTIRLGTWATKGGQYWTNNGGGVAHNKLLASLAAAMDVEMPAFGSTKYPGLLTELQG